MRGVVAILLGCLGGCWMSHTAEAPDSGSPRPSSADSTIEPALDAGNDPVIMATRDAGTDAARDAAVPPNETGITALSAGKEFTCAIQDGVLACAGRSYYGQLGTGLVGDNRVPTRV